MMYSVLIHMLKQYFLHSLSKEALEEWLVMQLQPIIDSRDERAIDVANQLDSLFIEMGEGIAIDADLQGLVEQLLSAYDSQFNLTSTGSTGQTFEQEYGQQPCRQNQIIYPAFGAVAVGT